MAYLAIYTIQKALPNHFFSDCIQIVVNVGEMTNLCTTKKIKYLCDNE